jgi:hypothetical protein
MQAFVTGSVRVMQGKEVAIKFVRWNGDMYELRSLQQEFNVMAALKVKWVCVLSCSTSAELGKLMNWPCASPVHSAMLSECCKVGY